jgi:hypothetical protein
MGRPLNKRNFVDATGIDVKFGASGTLGWIVKQLGSKEFRCAANGNDGSTYEDCKLVWDATANAANEVSIELYTGVFVKKIAGRKLTATDGQVYKWDLDGNDDSTAGFNLDNI